MNNASDIWRQLLADKAKAKSEIASTNDNVQLRRLNEWIGQVLDIEAKNDGLLAEAERLIRQRQNGLSEQTKSKSLVPGPSKADWSFQALPGKECARIARRSYLKREQDRGNYFEQFRGETVYRRKNDGSIWGITFSIPKNHDKTWFLGLPKKQPFDQALLLCQCGPRSVRVVHLPEKICQTYGPQLSTNRRQYLFNIRRNGETWSMQIPSQIEPVDITDFVEQDELDCSVDYVDFA